jgi:predicted dehydrogenase
MSKLKAPLRAAVIGVGYLGTFHAQKYKNNSNATLVGVCDHSPAQADKVASELGVSSVHRAHDLIGQVDLVSIAANTLSHFELAKMFLENGVHVNVEKPITATLPEAEKLIEIAKANKLKLAVGHIERFNPTIRDVRKLMKNPRIIELTRVGPYKARGADVSVLHDLMIHDMDLLYWLSGSEIESMEASGITLISKEVDTGTVSFRMKNGVLGLIHVSRVSPVGLRSLKVTQDDAIISANTGLGEIELIQAGSNRETDPIKVTKTTVAKEDALQKETDTFVDAVLNDTECAVTGVDGYKALQAIEEIQKLIQKANGANSTQANRS